jgi:transcription initiation factor TFIIIB Brf1 subunit/transcription initiation factor TFIIB
MDKKIIDKQGPKRCLIHPNSPIRVDPDPDRSYDHELETYCSTCGRKTGVIDSRPKHMLQLRREELGSKIPQLADKGADGKYAKGEIKKWTERISKSTNLHKFHQEYSDHDQVKTKHVLQEIEKICQKMTLPKFIEEVSKQNYYKIVYNNLQHKKKEIYLSFFCTYLACIGLKSEKSDLNIFSAKIGEDSKILKKFYSNMVKEMWKHDISLEKKVDDRIKQIKIAILDFPDHKISKKLKEESLKYLDDKRIESIVSGSPIISIAAGLIDIISRKNKLNVTPKKIANEFKISENTVRTQSKKIAELLEIVLLDKRRRK